MRKKWFLFLSVALILLVAALLPSLGADQAQAADSTWRARYWNNRALSGDPVLRRDENKIDHDWEDGSPASQVNDDDFSARWTRTVYFTAGTYRFYATMDDGMRVWIDDALVIDSWTDSQVHTKVKDLFMTTGDHEIKVEYYEAGGKAVAKFNWAAIAGPPMPPVVNWTGSYFNNMTLTGPPVLVRADNAIDFNWKLSSPWPAINNDHFSVRWQRFVNLNPGNYQFTVQTDDGVRLWINGQLIIDKWQPNQSAVFQASTFHPGGTMEIRLDYFENEGSALIKLDMQQAGGGAIQPTPQPPASPSLPGGNQALVVNARWVNVRATPEVGDNVIGAVAGGEIVTLLGRNGGWIKVRLPNTLQGWVGSSYLDSQVDFATLPVVN